MNKIERYSNWCEYDQLDGNTLIDGEELCVQFPDGTSLDLRVTVVESSYEASDMGHPWRVPVRKAYWETKVRGIPVRVPLVGLSASRV